MGSNSLPLPFSIGDALAEEAKALAKGSSPAGRHRWLARGAKEPAVIYRYSFAEEEGGGGGPLLLVPM